MNEKIIVNMLITRKLSNRDLVDSLCDSLDFIYGDENRKEELESLKNQSISEHDRKIMEESIWRKPHYQFSIFKPSNFCKQKIFVNPKELNYNELLMCNSYLIMEARRRGLKVKVNRYILKSREFMDWCEELKNNATYVSEVSANNHWGDSSFEFTYDPAVRKASKLLKEKGYHTYWSSANVEDTKSDRFGVIFPNKNVAFILIDPKNLPENIKSKIYLGVNDWVWGNANEYKEDGKIYGIWAELKPYPKDNLCSTVSKNLVSQANLLPNLTKKEVQETEYGIIL